MGDRAVVGFAPSADAPTIYLYSHWGASSLIADTQRALREAQGRWSDSEYATRVAISQIIGDGWRGETGYGLSVDSYAMPDLPYVLRIVWDERKVYVLSDWKQCGECGRKDVEAIGELTFDAFLSAVNEDLESLLS